MQKCRKRRCAAGPKKASAMPSVGRKGKLGGDIEYDDVFLISYASNNEGKRLGTVEINSTITNVRIVTGA